MSHTFQKTGTEFLVNTQTAGDQSNPTITGLGNGGFVVSWQDYAQGYAGTLGDDKLTNIKAQVFSAAGVQMGGEILVNTQTFSLQRLPTITGLVNGGFVVSWDDYSGTLGDADGISVKAQVFNASGISVGDEFLVNTQTALNQLGPRITGLANGGFLVSWSDFSGTLGDSSGSSVKAQIFNAAGTRLGGEFLVNTETASNQGLPTITGLANGGFVVSWVDGSGTLGDASSTSIKAQVFTATGVQVGGEFLVNTQTSGDQLLPTITGLADGGFVVSWRDDSSTLGDASGSSIKAQIFTAAGARVGDEFLVNTQIAGDQSNPTITGLTNGGFVVSWSDFSGTLGDASGSSVKAQIFNAAGTRLGGEFLVNTETFSQQRFSTITGLANGGFVVSWQDLSGTLGDASGSSIKAQVFTLAVNDAPTGTPTATLSDGTEDTPYTFTLSSLLQGFSDPDGDTLSVTGLTTSNGALANNGNGTYTLTPLANSNGPVTLGYTVSDGQGGALAGQTRSFTLAAVNDAPTGATFQKTGTEFLVNTQTANGQVWPTITGLASGGFVVSWMDFSGTLGDASSTSIKAQVFTATGVQVGGEFLVNTQTATDQRVPAITGLANGGFVVSWSDSSGTMGDASGSSIKAQVFTAAGVKVGGEFLVNTQTVDGQDLPTITALANGGFVVSWWNWAGGFSEGSTSVKAQVFNAAGDRVGGEFLVNTQTENLQLEPTIAGLADGGFVVSWRVDSSALNGGNIKAQIFTDTGAQLGSEFRVNTHTANGLVNGQVWPTIAGLANGGFVVSWTDNSRTLGDDSGNSIKAQVFTSMGAKVGGEFLVNTQTASNQERPTVTGLTNGGFVVSWSDFSGTLGDSSGSSVKAQVFSAAGVKAGGEFLVNTQTANLQAEPTVASLAGGGFVVSWTDDYGTLGDVSRSSVKAQIFNLAASNDAPTSVLANGTEDTPYTFNLSSMLEGFSDPEGDTLSVTDLTTSNGTLVNNGNGTYTLTPFANLNGPVMLGFTVSDGNGGVLAGQRGSFTLAAVNDAPGAPTLTGGTVAENAVAGTVVGTLSAIDPDGDVLTYQIVGGTGAGLFAIAGNAIVVAPGAVLDFEALSSFSLQVVAFDGARSSLPQSFTIALTDAPEGTNGGIKGGAGPNLLIGTPQADVIAGNGGDDTLLGLDSSDALYGGADRDILIGDGPVSLTAAAQSVRRLYIATLDRSPDDAGWIDWTMQLESAPKSRDQIAAGFVGSQEFQLKYGALDNAGFVTQLFRNVLDREPDASGFAAYLGALDTGALTRTGMVTGFSESAEFKLGMSPELHAGQVFRLYGATLARQPDAAGFEGWTDTLGGGRSLVDIVAGFVNSIEFQLRFGGRDNAGFVTLLYENVLGRDPDAAGLASWVSQLDVGARSRTQVVLGFSESQEYVNGTRAGVDGFMRQMMTSWSDTLTGGPGDDKLTGGRGSDRFVFTKSEGGNDIIYGFESFDTLELNGFGLASSAQALGAMSQQGADVVFDYTGGSIAFADTQLSTLQSLSAQGWVLG